MKTIKLVALVGAFLAFAACGGTGAPMPGDGMGSLTATVQAIHNGSTDPILNDIDHIQVTLTNTATSTATPFDLTSDGATPPTWTGDSPRVIAGSYTAVAVAYDSNDAALWTADPVDTDIVEGSHATLTFFINEQVEGDFDTPHITSLLLSTDTLFTGEDLVITVGADGGATGDLTLSGRFAGGLGSSGDAAHGSFGAGATFTAGSTGSITWTSGNTVGNNWFILSVTDTEGNVAEVGVDYEVSASGDVAVELNYNQAPEFDVVSRTLNDGDGTAVYLWMNGVQDPEGAAMQWSWDDSDCNGLFVTDFSVPYNDQANVAPSSGTVAASTTPTDLFVQYGIARGDGPVSGSCVLTLTVEDDHGAVASEAITIYTDRTEAP